METEEQTAPKVVRAKTGAASAAPSSRRRITDLARQRAEEDAAMIPTTAEEYRRFERASALLKSIAPAVEAIVIKTPVKMDPRSTIPRKNPRKGEEGEPAFLPAVERPLKDRVGNIVHHHAIHIAGDDMADASPGSPGREFMVGDRVKLTEEAAERLAAQGWVKLV